MAKDRVTVLVCINLTGTDKSPLLAIGKYKKPRCFHGFSCLPTEYEASSNAWMNATILKLGCRNGTESLLEWEENSVIYR